jgi:heme-degrading monooxygenase HmoA
MYAAIVSYRPSPGKTPEEIEARFVAATPLFEKMPGLKCKYFCFDVQEFEGTSVYIWESREAATACFESPLFRESFRNSFGCEPSIKYVEVKHVVDNTAR